MGAHSGPKIVTDGLVLYLDAANPRSYPGTGNVWYDLVQGDEWTLSNASVWVDGGAASYMNFTSGIAKRIRDGALSNMTLYSNVTIFTFASIVAPNAQWKTLIRGATHDHQIIISTSDGVSLGMYDNSGGNFQDTGYNIDYISNYLTAKNFLAWKLSATSPYYQFFYNENQSSPTANLTSANSVYHNGFASIGAHHNLSANPASHSQYFGNVAVFAYYNRHLTEEEMLQNYNALRGRFGV